MAQHYGRKLPVLAVTCIAVSLQRLILLPVLLRYLGDEAYGIWALILPLAELLVPLCLLALPDAFTRFAAGVTDTNAIARSYYTILAVVIACGACLITLVSVNAGLLSRFFASSQSFSIHTLYIAAPLATAMALNATAAAYFRTMQRPWFLAGLQWLTATLTIGGAIAMAASGRGINAILIAYGLAHLVTFAIAQMRIVREVGVARPDLARLKPFLLFSLPLLPMVAMQWVTGVSDRYVISLYEPIETGVAPYAVSYTLGITIMVLYAPFFALLPAKLTAAWEQNDTYTVNKVLAYSIKYSLILAIPATIAFGIVGSEIIVLFRGTPFDTTPWLIALIAAGHVFHGVAWFHLQVFMLSRATGHFTMATFLAGSLNLIGNLILVPVMGIMGAALMTAIAYLAQMLYAMISSRRHHRLDMAWGFLVKSLLGTGVMAAVLFLIKPMIRPSGSLVTVTVCGLIGVVIYALAMLILRAWTRDELTFFKSLLSGRN